MKRLYISLLAILLSATLAIAQVGGGIYNPNSSSGGGGSVPATSITGVSAYSYIGNNTNASANASSLQYPIWGVPAYTVVAPTTLARITGASTSYAEFNIQNETANVGASTDFVATADNGSETTHYSDFGVNSSLGGGAPFTDANAGYSYSTDNEFDIGALGSSGVVNIYGGPTPTLVASFNQNGNVTIPQLNVAGAVTNSSAGLLSTTAITGTGNIVAATNPTLTVLDGSFTLKNTADATKTAVFSLAGLPTSSNATYTLPSAANSTLATISALTQTFTGNTTFSNTLFTVQATSPVIGNSTAASTINIGTGATLNATTKAVNIGTAGVSGSTTNLQIGSAVSGSLGTTTINSPTFNFGSTNTAIDMKDSSLFLQDDGDATKQLQFQLSGISTGTTRTLTSPNASGTLAILGLAQTWSATQTFSSIAFSPTTSGILGSTAGDAASAGVVGEILEQNIPAGSAVSLVNNTAKTVATITLTAGDWDIWGDAVFVANTGTTTGALVCSLSTTTNVQGTPPNGGAYNSLTLAFGTASTNSLPCGMMHLSVATNTSIFLVGTANFAASTETAYGYIGARRRR